MDRRGRPGKWIREYFQNSRLTRLEVTSLTEMLDRLELAQREHEQVSIDAMLEATGRRSFGPLLLVPGLLGLSPASGVPGVPTLTGIMVFFITAQLLLGRTYFWLPRWVLDRTITYTRLQAVVRFLRPIARFVDRLLRPRLVWLTQSNAVYLVALVCMLIALTMPPLELVPFAATSAGIALTAFGLALIGHDGLLALLTLLFCVCAPVVVFMVVL